MKKKILLFIALLSIVACFFAISISAETPSMYIEFGARFPGSDEYITVYTQNAEGSGNPRINFKDYAFYSDVDFTQEVDISTVTGLDFSVAVSHNSSNPVNRITNPSSPFVNCTEVKWFTQDKAMDNSVPGSMFNGWSGLKSFDFGNAKVLGDNAFQGCGFEQLVIPSTITQIKNSTFRENASLTSVKFEGCVTSIGSSTFYNCKALKDVDLGKLTTTGSSMFDGCTSITTIVLPSTMVSINSQAFLSCSALTSVTLNEGLVSIGERAFESSGVTSIEIPSTLTTISKKSFYKCSSLTSVTFAQGTSLNTIGDEAFSKVPASNLSIPKTVTKIGSSAFSGSGIVTAYINKNVTSVGSNAFYEAKSLTTVEFEEGFAGTIGTSCFCNASALKTVVLVEGIKEIPYQCFYSTGIESIIIPDSVTSIANRGFSQSSSLTTVTISENSSLKTLGSAFNGTKLTSIYLPTGVKITESPFSSCNNLEYVYNFENAVIETSSGLNVIPKNFFSECRALKEIVFPDGITSIGSSVFNRCGALEVIVFPASITSIDKSAFPTTSSWLSPKNAVIFYCGGTAEELLALTDDGAGNVCAFISDRINGGAVAEYTGYDAEYMVGTIVYNANCCDIYYNSIHEEDNNPCVINCNRCGLANVAEPNPVHNETTEMSYERYDAEGAIITACTNEGCKHTSSVSVPALFICRGYSAPLNGNGSVTLGFALNREAINAYSQSTGKTLEYGVFAVAQVKLGENNVLNADGTETAGVIKADVSKIGFDFFEIKITGFETDDQKDAKIAMGAYVIATKEETKEISYIQESDALENENYSFASYNDVVSSLS